MNTMLYGAVANVGTTIGLSLVPAPETAKLQLSEASKGRTLIALVGRKGTGKHTYLEQYYQRLGLDKYMHLSYGFIEQRGMHPCEQREHMDRVKRLDYPGLPDPYMFVTYSPYILDAMGWESVDNVICFHRNESTGRLYRGSLLCHPESCWNVGTDESITLGKFWDAVGEDWLEEYGEDVTWS